jgi:hypothetical protein
MEIQIQHHLYKENKNYIVYFIFKSTTNNNKKIQQELIAVRNWFSDNARERARELTRSLAREERESSRTKRNRGRREGTKMRRDKKIGAWISLRDPQVNLDFTSLIGHRGPQMSNVEA